MEIRLQLRGLMHADILVVKQAKRMREAADRLREAITQDGDVATRAYSFLTISRSYRRIVWTVLDEKGPHVNRRVQRAS